MPLGPLCVRKEEGSVEIGRKTGPHSPLIPKCNSPVLDNRKKGCYCFYVLKRKKANKWFTYLVLEMGKLGSSGKEVRQNQRGWSQSREWTHSSVFPLAHGPPGAT